MGQPQKLTLKTDSQPVSNSLQFTTALQHVYSGMLANHSGQSSLPNIEIGLWIKQVEIVFLLLPPVFYLNCKCHPTGQEVFQAHPDFTKGSKNICNQCQYKMCSIFIKNFMHDTHIILQHIMQTLLQVLNTWKKDLCHKICEEKAWNNCSEDIHDIFVCMYSKLMVICQ